MEAGIFFKGAQQLLRPRPTDQFAQDTTLMACKLKNKFCQLSLKPSLQIPKFLQPKYYFRFPMDLIFSLEASDLKNCNLCLPFNKFKTIQGIKTELDTNLLHIYFRSIDPGFYSSFNLVMDQLEGVEKPEGKELIYNLWQFLAQQRNFRNQLMSKDWPYKNIYETQSEYQKANSDFFETNSNYFVFCINYKANQLSNFYPFINKFVFNSFAEDILTPQMNLKEQFQEQGIFEFINIQSETLIEIIAKYINFLNFTMMNLQNITGKKFKKIQIQTLDKIKISCELSSYYTFFMKPNEFDLNVFLKIQVSEEQQQLIKFKRQEKNTTNTSQQQNLNTSQQMKKNTMNLNFLKQYYPEYLNNSLQN